MLIVNPNLVKWCSLNTLPHTHISRTFFNSSPRQWCGLHYSPSCVSTTEHGVKQTQKADTGSICGEMALLRSAAQLTAVYYALCLPILTAIQGYKSLWGRGNLRCYWLALTLGQLPVSPAEASCYSLIQWKWSVR